MLIPYQMLTKRLSMTPLSIGTYQSLNIIHYIGLKHFKWTEVVFFIYLFFDVEGPKKGEPKRVIGLSVVESPQDLASVTHSHALGREYCTTLENREKNGQRKSSCLKFLPNFGCHIPIFYLKKRLSNVNICKPLLAVESPFVHQGFSLQTPTPKDYLQTNFKDSQALFLNNGRYVIIYRKFSLALPLPPLFKGFLKLQL